MLTQMLKPIEYKSMIRSALVFSKEGLTFPFVLRLLIINPLPFETTWDILYLCTVSLASWILHRISLINVVVETVILPSMSVVFKLGSNQVIDIGIRVVDQGSQIL